MLIVNTERDIFIIDTDKKIFCTPLGVPNRYVALENVEIGKRMRVLFRHTVLETQPLTSIRETK
jgi:hypothetical protein